jgi:hypothetical protein
MEVVKAMIHDQDLSMYLWAEAARTVVYVQNISPHKVLENKTPEEVFSGKFPEVSHLRIFGCPVYIHIPKDKRTKLDPSGNENLIIDCKKKLASEFKMKDLGQMHYFLGLEVWQNPSEICLSQGKYVVEILKRFGMMDCKSMTTPMTTNPKLLCDTSSEIVDARHMFCCEHFKSVYG